LVALVTQAAHYAPRLSETTVAYLVNQRPVTALQRFVRLSSIPLIRPQRLKNNVPFHLFDGILCQTLQSNRCRISSRHRNARPLLSLLLLDHGLWANQHVPSHSIGQLTDISLPIQALQILHQFRRDWIRLHAKLFHKLMFEELHEQWNILSPLSQCRQFQTENMNPIVQVLAESSRFYLFLKVFVCRTQ